MPKSREDRKNLLLGASGAGLGYLGGSNILSTLSPGQVRELGDATGGAIGRFSPEKADRIAARYVTARRKNAPQEVIDEIGDQLYRARKPGARPVLAIRKAGLNSLLGLAAMVGAGSLYGTGKLLDRSTTKVSMSVYERLRVKVSEDEKDGIAENIFPALGGVSAGALAGTGGHNIMDRILARSQKKGMDQFIDQGKDEAMRLWQEAQQAAPAWRRALRRVAKPVPAGAAAGLLTGIGTFKGMKKLPPEDQAWIAAMLADTAAQHAGNFSNQSMSDSAYSSALTGARDARLMADPDYASAMAELTRELGF